MKLPTTRHRHQNTTSRQGTLTIELLLVLPILLTLLAGMIQFSMVLTARQQLLAASREGARVAARGADINEIHSCVHRTLGHGSLEHAKVHCQRIHDDSPDHVCSRDRVEVTVHVPSDKAVPNFLCFIARLGGTELSATTVMHCE